MSAPARPETLSVRTRRMAQRFDQIGDDLKASHRIADNFERVEHVKRLGTEILVEFLPILSHLERNKPESALTVKERLRGILFDAVEAAGFNAPEFSENAEAKAGNLSEVAARSVTVHVTSILFAASLRDWANTFEEEGETVWYHGGAAYSRDGKNTVVVTPEEHLILEAFLNSSVAMKTRQLETATGLLGIARRIKKLCARYGGFFADAIRRPKGKGAGGYYARVRRPEK